MGILAAVRPRDFDTSRSQLCASTTPAKANRHSTGQPAAACLAGSSRHRTSAGAGRREAAEKEAAARRATEKQILEDADHLITVWNERQANRMPMLFSPTIGAAITAGYWFLRARCPACRTTGDVDLRTLDWHHGAAVTALTLALSCRSCRPKARPPS
jgi:hypothetical protein